METLLQSSLNIGMPSPNNGMSIFFIINCIEIPFIFFAFYSAIKSPCVLHLQAIRVLVINLLIADLIQNLCLFLLHIGSNIIFNVSPMIDIWVAFTALHFRMCIAIERYSQICPNCPLKVLVLTLLSGWLLPLMCFTAYIFSKQVVYVILFIPHVVVILCFVGACWSLFHSKSLTPVEKRFALAPIFLMLISFIILTLPLQIILFIYVKTDTYQNDLYLESSLVFTLFVVIILYMLNPLVDCLLCVFMRSDAENRMPHYFSRLQRNQRETGDASSADVQLDCA